MEKFKLNPAYSKEAISLSGVIVRPGDVVCGPQFSGFSVAMFGRPAILIPAGQDEKPTIGVGEMPTRRAATPIRRMTAASGTQPGAATAMAMQIDRESGGDGVEPNEETPTLAAKQADEPVVPKVEPQVPTQAPAAAPAERVFSAAGGSTPAPRRAPKAPEKAGPALEDIKGVGASRAEALREAGIDSVQAVAECSPDELVSKVRGLNLQTAKSVVRAAKHLLEG